MTRRALLIESSQIQGQPDLPGARVDLTNWRSFLLSNMGGAWRNDEITELSKPSWTHLQGVLAAERWTDYVFITFSGHGYHLIGRDLDESRVCLNEEDDVAVNLINPGNPRCSFVVDACRQVVIEKSLRESLVANRMALGVPYTQAAEYRKLFDTAVAQAEKGIIRLFSCDIDEAASESSASGGYYTRALMDCCREWHDQARQGERYYYSLWSSHSCASRKTTLRAPQQHPQYEGGRRNNHFPLAIKP